MSKNRNFSPRVSVLMSTYNCGSWIKQAVESVRTQIYSEWELIIVDDGSTDNTCDILTTYEEQQRIKVIHQKNRGLAAASQAALDHSQGEYVIRLDADDWFDENILLILVNILDTHRDYAMVYTDYYETDEKGEILLQQVKSKVNGDNLLDLPALNTGTMIRRHCLMEVGGYTETIRCQDNYDLWIRFIQKYRAYNVNLPLWNYRRRTGSLSTYSNRIGTTRRQIKADYVAKTARPPKVLGVVPIRRLSSISHDLPFMHLNGKRLIEYTLDEALKVEEIDQLVVTTNHEDLMKFVADRYPGVICIPRPKALAAPNVGIAPTMLDVFDRLGRDSFDLAAVLHVHCPLRRAEHIKEAIDTLTIFESDSVISVTEDSRQHYRRTENGLVPVANAGETLRLERQTLYCGNGAVFVTRPECVKEHRLLGNRVSHILMKEDESVAIHSEYDLWLATKILLERHHKHEGVADVPSERRITQ